MEIKYENPFSLGSQCISISEQLLPTGANHSSSGGAILVFRPRSFISIPTCDVLNRNQSKANCAQVISQGNESQLRNRVVSCFTWFCCAANRRNSALSAIIRSRVLQLASTRSDCTKCCHQLYQHFSTYILCHILWTPFPRLPRLPPLPPLPSTASIHRFPASTSPGSPRLPSFGSPSYPKDPKLKFIS